jgi:hypothetical protein
MPIAGRSLRPSWASLARWSLRFALQAARRNQTPAPGHGQPLASFSDGAEGVEPVCPNVAAGFLKWPQVFNLRNSTSGVLPVQVENLHPLIEDLPESGRRFITCGTRRRVCFLCRLKTCTHLSRTCPKVAAGFQPAGPSAWHRTAQPLPRTAVPHASRQLQLGTRRVSRPPSSRPPIPSACRRPTLRGSPTPSDPRPASRCGGRAHLEASTRACNRPPA